MKYITGFDLWGYLTTDEFKSVVCYLKVAGHAENYQTFFEELNRTAHPPNDKTILQMSAIGRCS